MEPVNAITLTQNIKIGFGFGVSQFTMFGCFAGMFYGAGLLLEAYWSMQMEDVMAALFAIMFAASQAGNAAGFGPDIGKATVAAQRVFKIIDFPSQIDARASVEKGLKVPETF